MLAREALALVPLPLLQRSRSAPTFETVLCDKTVSFVNGRRYQDLVLLTLSMEDRVGSTRDLCSLWTARKGGVSSTRFFKLDQTQHRMGGGPQHKHIGYGSIEHLLC